MHSQVGCLEFLSKMSIYRPRTQLKPEVIVIWQQLDRLYQLAKIQGMEKSLNQLIDTQSNESQFAQIHSQMINLTEIIRVQLGIEHLQINNYISNNTNTNINVQNLIFEVLKYTDHAQRELLTQNSILLNVIKYRQRRREPTKTLKSAFQLVFNKLNLNTADIIISKKVLTALDNNAIIDENEKELETLLVGYKTQLYDYIKFIIMGNKRLQNQYESTWQQDKDIIQINTDALHLVKYLITPTIPIKLVFIDSAQWKAQFKDLITVDKATNKYQIATDVESSIRNYTCGSIDEYLKAYSDNQKEMQAIGVKTVKIDPDSTKHITIMSDRTFIFIRIIEQAVLYDLIVKLKDTTVDNYDELMSKCTKIMEDCAVNVNYRIDFSSII